jgi:hypothetical protein
MPSVLNTSHTARVRTCSSKAPVVTAAKQGDQGTALLQAGTVLSAC